jgi:hypothetical protein
VAPEEYREELAALLTEAAVQGRIPRTFRAHNRALVVDFTRPAEAGWYCHKLMRSDNRAWWAAIQPIPPHFPGLMPEFGSAVGELRALHGVVEAELRAATALHRLRLRLFGPVTPLDMPPSRPRNAHVTPDVTPVD